MITEIYREYFQKSYTFLYPLLGIKKKFPKPEHTYMFWPDISDEPCKLFCIYKKEKTDLWRKFERDFLITHKMLDHCIPIDDENILYVFDLNCFSADYKKLLDGKYSQFSTEARKLITDYYGVHTPEWVYIESFMFPQKYFKKYAELLDVDVEFLKSVGELCPKYDKEKETCSLQVKVN